jgi:hypothetical protein
MRTSSEIGGKAGRERKHPILDTGGWTRAQSKRSLRLDGVVRHLLVCSFWPMKTRRSGRYEQLALGETPYLGSYQDGRT